MVIEYRFNLEDGNIYQFSVDLARASKAPPQPLRKHAFWTELGFQQCSGCPLKSSETPTCPAAADLEDVITTFKNIISYQTARVEVTTPERTISKSCDVQTGLRSLVGLVMATSSCPVLSRLKGLAHTHLPFATLEETVVRTVGAYLLRQYLVQREGGTPDWELKGLESFYRELLTLDGQFKKRIDAASEMDANMNAIGSLGFLAMGVSFSIEDMLKELKVYSIPSEQKH